MADDVQIEMCDELEGVLNILVNVTEKSGNLRNDYKQDIMKSILKIRKIFNNVTLELNDKKEEILNLKSELIKEKSLKSNQDLATQNYNKLYSDVASNGLHKNVNRKYKIIVKSKSEQTAEVMKTEIKTNINPSNIKVGISGFKSLRNGHVVIVSDNEKDAEIIKDEINSKCGTNLEAITSKPRNPQIIIYNVPQGVTLENVEKIIRNQNSDLLSEEKVIIPRYIFKNKNKVTNNIILEVNSLARTTILERKLKMGWNICAVDDYFSIRRCFKCCKYNHKASDCRGTLACPICSEDHEIKQCTSNKENYKCINCINYNKYNKNEKVDENHTSLDKNCPCKLALISKYKTNTNY